MTCRLLSWLSPCRLDAVEKPAFVPRNPPPSTPQLGPNQLAWLETRLPFFQIHRRQAEAKTGVAAVNSGEVKT